MLEAPATGLEDVSKDGGVLIKRLKSNPGGASAADGDCLQINYVGRIHATGAEFDRSHGGYAFEFELGAGKVISGWDVAFRHLLVGESAELRIAAGYGYGDEGSVGSSKADTIPPGATLDFSVEFVGIKGGVKSNHAQNDRERLIELRKAREESAASAKAAKEAKATKALEAKAKLSQKMAAKNKKGKGGGKATYVKKEKAEKTDKKKNAKKKAEPDGKQAEEQAAAAPPSAPPTLSSSIGADEPAQMSEGGSEFDFDGEFDGEFDED